MFQEVQKRTGMTDKQMLGTLNCGVGLVVVAPAENANDVKATIQKHHFKTYELGSIAKDSQSLYYPGE